ncbi:hypothetical protein E1286_22375 [Nonomuraea terrae]|uniref:Uncharacterized protein n=1 Tax=Nonomuraea terrae TaxID=2530383 RepID=A0A4R4YLZ8_9ACTN|nr:hypothetical protein [Nonomuraea terrae]TDD45976.1 hypothetical protein E1286_22375 [Nonomuraea terrae]
MTPAPPSDADLNTMIRARLAALGIDLDQFPPGTVPDPETGAPGRDTVLASLRSFVRGTVTSLAAYQLPAPDGGADPALSQQRAPMMYPSISVEWRR